MRSIRHALLTVVLATTTVSLDAAEMARPGGPGDGASGAAADARRLAREAASADAATAGRARLALRALGPAGLDAFQGEHAAALEAMRAGLAAGRREPSWERLRAAADAVAAQRDAAWSGLYWYTDLGEAVAAAQASGRPVLSLRLLGRLDEEYSCANSRFFRTALYANREVAAALREGWVLHWQSVRPAPRLTVDFGDGRRMVRTVTGNSLHLALTSDGQPVDVLPGLCGPGDFARWQAAAGALARRVARLSPQARREALSQTYTPGRDRVDLPSREERLAASRLDERSRQLLRAKALPAWGEARTTRLLAAFERSLAEDAERNETEYRTRILEWFARGEAPAEATALTSRVYDEVFLTPGSDPWLGLLPADAYSALEGEGLEVPAASSRAGAAFATAGLGPSARVAAPIAQSKMLVERPLVSSLVPAEGASR